jgi:exopolysaccharide production protein ExoQ
MIFWLAFLICSAGIAGLFFLDRDKSVRNSKALWLPVIWLWLIGSRPVSVWLGTGNSSVGALASTLDGNPMDAAIYATLLGIGVVVLLRRKKRTNAFLAANGPIIVYFLYCLISVVWSPFPGPACKRWIKALGDLVMVLILLTDGQPVAALRRVYSRVGFILLPFSVVLIRYSDLGRGYDIDGNPMITGVTTNKNSLGLIVYLISLGALWSVRALLKDKKAPNRTRRLVAQGTLLIFGIELLQMAHSATSIACFILGGGLMLATGLRAIRKRPARVHALCLGIALVGGLAMLFGGGSALSSALGRGSGLSGRTDIWKCSIAAADSPVLGTGFESFWNANAHKVAQCLTRLGFLDMSNLVSAHNGYLEVYLDIGLVGLCLMALILISGYRHAGEAFRRDSELGGLILAYLVTGVFYSVTEAGFRLMSPSWIFLLLALVSANCVASGLFGGKERKTSASVASAASSMPVTDAFIPVRESVYPSRRRLNSIEIARGENLCQSFQHR